jgi:hypothetical protein
MEKIIKLIENFCIKYEFFYKPRIKELYVEKQRLALRLKGIELKVYNIIPRNRSSNTLYVPYIQEYYGYGQGEKPWWDCDRRYDLHAYTELNALYTLIKRIQKGD